MAQTWLWPVKVWTQDLGMAVVIWVPWVERWGSWSGASHSCLIRLGCGVLGGQADALSSFLHSSGHSQVSIPGFVMRRLYFTCLGGHWHFDASAMGGCICLQLCLDGWCVYRVICMDVRTKGYLFKLCNAKRWSMLLTVRGFNILADLCKWTT